MNNDVRQVAENSFLIPNPITQNVIWPGLRIVETIALAEYCSNKELNQIWLQNELLLKRRGAYSLDWHIQGMIESVGQYGDFKSRVIACGTSGMYRTELKNGIGQTIHFFQGFDPHASYLVPYLAANNTLYESTYGVFQYTQKNGIIKKLVFSLPGEKGITDDRTMDITVFYNSVKQKIDYSDIQAALSDLTRQISISANSIKKTSCKE